MTAAAQPAVAFATAPGAAAVAPRPRLRTDALNLKSCELRHPGSDRLVERALARVRVEDTRSYPYQAQTLAALARVHDTPVEGITLTAGSDAAIGLLVDAFARPAGGLVVARPAFEAWEYYARLREVPVTGVPVLVGTPPRTDLGALAGALADAPSPAVVALANPVSPAGLVLDTAEVAELAVLAAHHGHLLVVDECYGAFTGTTHVPLLRHHPNLVVVRSCSKAYALAGARLAAVFSRPGLAAELFKYRPDSTVSGTALALLGQGLDALDEYRAVWADLARIREEFVAAVLADRPGWTFLAPGGNFATFVTGDPELPDRIAAGLAERGVRIRSLTSLTGLSGAFRVSLADDATMRRVAGLIREVSDHHA
ncbi:aminotransferase class I/II-fold pyridoxal phosphate-dependent enzyme [Streptomyces capillispiralis]|uniref:aminotransferase class I/II-fold pyridoxal phosphate-dependent enzyme n=1 Tax=Streptomyces capillispiralis TaxID=68182 RepID=UPI0036863B80